MPVKLGNLDSRFRDFQPSGFYECICESFKSHNAVDISDYNTVYNTVYRMTIGPTPERMKTTDHCIGVYL